ncbi:MAG: hypothetical protein JEY79_03535 [Pseudodesulfovibrio sp.]|nr:hypothetical protein [Pseudodesulfovibrio sp.]
MVKPYSKPSSLPGRVLARIFLIFIGFLLGVALFTPWDKIWASALSSIDEKLPTIGLTWGSIDHDGPFGFRVMDFRITVADTPGDLHFKHAYVKMGFSPLANVQLNTGGSKCQFDMYQNGSFEFEGDLNLTYLLGYSDFKGILRASGNLFMPAGSVLPKSGWVDIRSPQLVLPGDKIIEDIAFTSEIKGADMNIRDFSMRLPLTYKSAGTAILNPDNIYLTTFKLDGEMTVGKQSFPYAVEGSLADAIW